MGAKDSAWINKGKPTEPIWAKGEPLEDEGNPQPKKTMTKQESTGAEGENWGGNPQPEP
jgi:hypothetical protein